eukprot:gene10026-25198_t
MKVDYVKKGAPLFGRKKIAVVKPSTSCPLLAVLALMLSGSTASSNIRLVGSTRRGRLELKYGGQWSTVCDDGFGSEDGAVACRQLGLGSYVGTYDASGGSGTIWYDDMACYGSESSLYDCNRRDPGSNCGHGEDVGLECRSKEEQCKKDHRLTECSNQTKCTAGTFISKDSITAARNCSRCQFNRYQPNDDHRYEACESQPTCSAGQLFSANSAAALRICSACPQDTFQSVDNHRNTACTAQPYASCAGSEVLRGGTAVASGACKVRNGVVAGPVLVLALLIGAGLFFFIARRKPQPDRSRRQRKVARRRASGGGGIPTSKSFTAQSTRFDADAFPHTASGTVGEWKRSQTLSVVVNNAFSIPFGDDPFPHTASATVGRLQRSQTLRVVVNNAYSIPFDDDGGAGNSDEAVVAAATAAAGHKLVRTDDAGESIEVVVDDLGALLALPDNSTQDGFKENGEAHFYQNEDYENVPTLRRGVDIGTPWDDGGLQGGRRNSYENAPTLRRGVDIGTSRDDGGVQGGRRNSYENAPTLRRGVDIGTSRDDGGVQGGRRNSYENVPTLRRGVDIGTSRDDGGVQVVYQNEDYENAPTLRRGVDIKGSATSTSRDTLRRNYENVSVLALRKHERRGGAAKPADPTVYSDGLAALQQYGIPDPLPQAQRVHDNHGSDCQCGGAACKMARGWWCDVCGDESTASLTFEEAVACEQSHVGAEQALEAYEVVEVRQHQGIRSNPDPEQALEAYEVVEVRQHQGMRSNPDPEQALEANEVVEVRQDGSSTAQAYSAITGNIELYGGEGSTAQAYSAITGNIELYGGEGSTAQADSAITALLFQLVCTGDGVNEPQVATVVSLVQWLLRSDDPIEALQVSIAVARGELDATFDVNAEVDREELYVALHRSAVKPVSVSETNASDPTGREALFLLWQSPGPKTLFVLFLADDAQLLLQDFPASHFGPISLSELVADAKPTTAASLAV